MPQDTVLLFHLLTPSWLIITHKMFNLHSLLIHVLLNHASIDTGMIQPVIVCSNLNGDVQIQGRTHLVIQETK